jgi:hypothetical protein
MATHRVKKHGTVHRRWRATPKETEAHKLQTATHGTGYYTATCAPEELQRPTRVSGERGVLPHLLVESSQTTKDTTLPATTTKATTQSALKAHRIRNISHEMLVMANHLDHVPLKELVCEDMTYDSALFFFKGVATRSLDIFTLGMQLRQVGVLLLVDELFNLGANWNAAVDRVSSTSWLRSPASRPTQNPTIQD